MKKFILGLFLIGSILGIRFPLQEKDSVDTLVLVDNWAYLDTHSTFFNILKVNGHKVIVKYLKEYELELQKYDEPVVDNIILMIPNLKASQPYGIVKKIMEFFDEPYKHLMIITDASSTLLVRNLAAELGIRMEPYGNSLYDDLSTTQFELHQNELSQIKVDKQIIYAKNIVDSEAISTVKSESKGVLFKGTGMTLDLNNKYVFPIISAAPTTYSQNFQNIKERIGEPLVLLAGYQSKYNNRAVVSGSLELFSDEYISYMAIIEETTNRKYSSNYKFIEQIIQWNFGQKGIVLAQNVRHHKIEESADVIPENYRINDQIVYYVDYYQWNIQKNEWEPLNEDKLQLEFIMLDPYVRTFLKRKEQTPTYYVEFQVPDKLGVFHFKTTYDRIGYNYVSIYTKIPIRQMRHDELPRYASAALPYYASVFLSLAGFFIFAVYFIYTKPKEHKKLKHQ